MSTLKNLFISRTSEKTKARIRNFLQIIKQKELYTLQKSESQQAKTITCKQRKNIIVMTIVNYESGI